MYLPQEKNDLRFYVYAYIRATDSNIAPAGTPYYIGKGQGNRCKRRSKHETLRAPKKTSFIIIIENNLTELGALALERRLIRWYGRIDIGTGILRNKTDGGDGGHGALRSQEFKEFMSNLHTGKIVSDVTRQKLSKINKGKTQSEETKEKKAKAIIGRTHSKETKEKMSTNNAMHKQEHRDKVSKAHLGLTHTEDSKKKMSNSRTGTKLYNNGVICKLFKEPPADGNWKPGKII